MLIFNTPLVLSSVRPLYSDVKILLFSMLSKVVIHNLKTTVVVKTAAMAVELPISHSVRALAISHNNEKSKYTCSNDEGRIERLCSRNEMPRTTVALRSPNPAATMDSLVRYTPGRVHCTIKAVCKNIYPKVANLCNIRNGKANSSDIHSQLSDFATLYIVGLYTSYFSAARLAKQQVTETKWMAQGKE